MQNKLALLRACAFSLLGRVSMVYTDRSRTIPLQHKLMSSTQSPNQFEDLVVLVFPRRHVHFVFPEDQSLQLRSIIDWCVAALNSRITPTYRALPDALMSAETDDHIPTVLHVTDGGASRPFSLSLSLSLSLRMCAVA
jgi:hypothetical protein